MIRLLAFAALLTLSACAGTPPPPDWKMNAQGGLAEFASHYLNGNAPLADLNFARARAEAARTGRPGLIARIELYRCAIRAAALEFDDCPGYLAHAADAQPAEQAYTAFLSGNWTRADTGLLPEHYRPLFKSDDIAHLAGIADPTARLIAAGVLFKSGRLTPADIDTAIDTASSQGWRRPLLAWLGVAIKRAEAAGDRDTTARLQRRIDLVSESTARK